ncbi:RsmB/NOP family class I SAM-dependent RNA methyltransferase [Candidatus Woesearchaeota archaeon]|nr:MAG: RsmB/NOP family class I SAM-dependent RNA methyltransferase [Candidatus Woesearchaeota archaeon]
MPKAIPNREEIEIKERFAEHYKALLGKDYDKFIDYSLSFLRRSIRVNTLKISAEEVIRRLGKEWILTEIPWCNIGFWVEHKEGRRDIGNTIEHSLGYIFVQEAASMIPPIVLDPKPGETVLDMCAAPGSKSTQIAAMMQNKGILVCNDYRGDRLKALGINLQRCGVLNAVITLMEGRFFKDVQFDKILVDAPCSGTGTIRKSLKTLRIWNPNMIKRLAGTQKQLISAAFNVLKPGGTLVYSTCSVEPEENEGVIDYLLSTFDNAKLDVINLNIKKSKPITSFQGKNYSKEVEKCLRIWPQDNDTEGFFVAKIRKN